MRARVSRSDSRRKSYTPSEHIYVLFAYKPGRRAASTSIQANFLCKERDLRDTSVGVQKVNREGEVTLVAG